VRRLDRDGSEGVCACVRREQSPVCTRAAPSAPPTRPSMLRLHLVCVCVCACGRGRLNRGRFPLPTRAWSRRHTQPYNNPQTP
jgi:hypothetical protein